MTERRRGLGRGLGALLPHASAHGQRAAAYGGDGLGAPAYGARAGAEHLSVVGTDRAGGGGTPPGGAVADSSDGPYHAAIDPGENARDVESSPARFADIDITSIRPNPRQPRQAFDEESLAELVHSVREIGILQPVVVRELPAGAGVQFELVMGERRWRAAREAGLVTIPAIIRDTPDTALLRDALLENLHRAQLNPLEEAAAYDQLLRDFGCTQEELAERIGRSRPQVSNTLRLLRLPPSVQRRLAAGVLSAGHARALLGLAEAAAQERLAQRIVAEGLSVRSVEEIVVVGSAGAATTAGTAIRIRRPVAPALSVLAERLADRYDTRVRIDLGRSKGRIIVEFASLPDLERIVAAMDPAGAPVREPNGEPNVEPSVTDDAEEGRVVDLPTS